MLKSRYFCGGSLLAVALAFGVSGTAAAQDGGATVEEVIVTGSFIAGTPEDAALPVDVIGSKEMEARGSPTMVQLIKTIPSSGAVIGENNRFGSGSGAATINLRNLNSPTTGSRTLVLFNGRRVPVSPQSLNSVDVNLLPTAAIGRVEVLKDGAAATYGSDAIGGVVNFITRTDLDGFEFSGQYQFIDGSDGDYEANLAWGKKWDNADALITLGYRHRSQLPIQERDWALRTGVDGFLQNPLGGWASTGNPGQYNVISSFAGSPNTGFTSATLGAGLPDIGCAANGGAPYNISAVIGLRQLNPDANSCQFQYTVFDNLVEEEEHFQAYGKFNFDITDTLSANVEVLYAMHDTPNQSWAVTGPNQFPTPLSAGGTSPIPALSPSDQGRFYIPASNPGLMALVNQVNSANCNGTVLPYGIDAASCQTALNAARTAVATAATNGVAASQTAWRPIGFGGNPYTEDKHAHYSYKVDTFRVSGGFKGELPFGINWDGALTYQQQDYTRVQEDLSVNRLQQGLRGFASRAGAADQCTAAETANWTTNAGNAAMGCYYFNPFSNGFDQSLSDVPANPFYVGSSAIPGFNEAVAARNEVVDWMDERLVNKMSTRLFVADIVLNGELPWELGGGAVKWAAGAQYRYDQYKQNPEVLHDVNATPCVDSVPFGDGQPYCLTPTGPYLFNANLAQYDVSREISSVFAETLLPITDDLELTLAARYEYYAGQGETFNPKASLRWQALDWLALRGSVGTTYRAPSAIITTTNFTRGLTNANGTWRANDQYGNPDLDPETAFTYSVGAMAKIGAFRATVDYWSFDFEDQLILESATDMLAAAFPSTGANVCTSTDPAYVALRSRFTFTDLGCGRANVQSYRTQYINGGKVKTSGVDFQASLDVGDLFDGQLTTGFDGTYLIQYDEDPYLIEGVPAPTRGTQERAGTYRASIFTGYNRVRANAYVNWASGIHNLRWQTRFISSVNQTESNSIGLAIATKTTTKIPEYWQHDLTYRAELPWDTTLTATVQNIFDEEPPFAIGTQYNYDPSSANPLGRVFAVAVKKRF
ncbi:TonB-dependent receptor [Phenylobacterium sp. NIBR 498073]|uniref:TonB-dependent receptor domain-containing protein n=1 Tax=Phenylobacterium sp. NIBR 498073 TaxID=3015177 RepID=UPI0022B2B159|nr:TonB-dependent receptor [Phenylobacterium sp. NIBR 498073]MBS0491342.1 TonB-dependent receptor [Pseudomonadota bacterium]WGU39867.1 TonB-dependent receptor [Phenylobacterium sp. NIBR 498073]